MNFENAKVQLLESDSSTTYLYNLFCMFTQRLPMTKKSCFFQILYGRNRCTDHLLITEQGQFLRCVRTVPIHYRLCYIRMAGRQHSHPLPSRGTEQHLEQAQLQEPQPRQQERSPEQPQEPRAERAESLTDQPSAHHMHESSYTNVPDTHGHQYRKTPSLLVLPGH